MKAQLIIATIVGLALAPLAGWSVQTAPVWSNTIAYTAFGNTVTVHQVVADGSGGCVVVFFYDTGSVSNWNILRFDKKGNQIQNIAFPAFSIDIVYCDKKVVTYVSAASPSVKYLASWDTAGKSTDGNVYNSSSTLCPAGLEYTKGSGAADKKGYFAVRYTTATKQYRLERYLYKSAK